MACLGAWEMYIHGSVHCHWWMMAVIQHQGVMSGWNQTLVQAAARTCLRARKEKKWPLLPPLISTDYDSDLSTSDDSTREEDMAVSLWRCARIKRPATHCHLCDHMIRWNVIDVKVTYWMLNTCAVSLVKSLFVKDLVCMRKTACFM